jgi:hypothetical protein
MSRARRSLSKSLQSTTGECPGIQLNLRQPRQKQRTPIASRRPGAGGGNRSAGAGPHFPGWLSCSVGRRIVNLFFRPNEPWYHAGARHQHPVDGVAVKKARGYTIWAFRSRLSRLLCAGLQLLGYALQAVAEALRLETAHQMRRGGKGCVSGGIDVTRAIFELGFGR